MARQLVVVDCERPTAYNSEMEHTQRLHELLSLLLARIAASGTPSLPLIAVANGATIRIFFPKDELDVHEWSMALEHTVRLMTTVKELACPGITALKFIPPETLSQLDRITFITPIGGQSCQRDIVSSVLDMLASTCEGCEMELVLFDSRQETGVDVPSIPTDMLLLQSEHNLEIHLLVDSISAASWLTSRVAKQLSVRVELQARWSLCCVTL